MSSSFGLQSQGFVIKTVQDLLEEIQQEQRQAFGPAIDTTADSVLGQVNGVVAGQLAQIWEVAQALSASLNPDFASGAALDAVAAVTGAVRLPAAPSTATLELLLNDSTSLPVGRIVSVGPAGPQYQTTAIVENTTGQRALIDAQVESVDLGPIPGNASTIDTIVTPAAGLLSNAAQFTENQEPFALANGQTLIVEVDEGAAQTVTFLSGDFANIAAATAAEVRDVINAALTGATAEALADGSVELQSDTAGTGSALRIAGSGNFALGFPRFLRRGFNSSKPAQTISGGAEPFSITTGDTLFLVVDQGSTQTVIFPSTGSLTAAEAAEEIESQVTGAGAYAVGDSVNIVSLSTGTSATIEVTGGTSNTEFLFAEQEFGGESGDVVLGRNTESDADFRLRRLELLATAGAGTLESIRSAVRQVDGTVAVFGRENVTDVVDSDGLPPKSFEIIVQGGEDQEIGQAIFDTKGAGILSHRNPGATGRTVAVVDSEGFSQDVNFTRPTEIPIYVTVTILTDPGTFGGANAVVGEQLVKDAIVAEGQTLNIGDDVVALRIRCAPLEVAGVLDVTAFAIGTAPAPVSDANIVIGGESRATFSTSNVVVTVTT